MSVDALPAVQDRRGTVPESLANLDAHNRLQHGAHPWMRRGEMPALAWTEDLPVLIDQFVGELAARCGGWEAMPLEARVTLSRARLLFGGCQLIERWAAGRGRMGSDAAGRGSLLHPRHGRLPRAITQDWVKFSGLLEEALDRLKPYFVENRRKPITVGEYLDAKRQDGAA